MLLCNWCVCVRERDNKYIFCNSVSIFPCFHTTPPLRLGEIHKLVLLLKPFWEQFVRNTVTDTSSQILSSVRKLCDGKREGSLSSDGPPSPHAWLTVGVEAVFFQGRCLSCQICAVNLRFLSEALRVPHLLWYRVKAAAESFRFH